MIVVGSNYDALMNIVKLNLFSAQYLLDVPKPVD
jgi:hypothetical protein